MVYNVENLFDIDGVSLFSEYGPDRYGPAKLATKLRNIGEIVGEAGGATGPEVILFQEFEVDQTPGGSPFDYAAFLRRTKGRSVSDLLGECLDAEVSDLPVEALLLKQLENSGLAPYQIAVGDFRPDPTGRTIAHTNVVFTRFPIIGSRTHHTDGARGILEVVIDVEGSPVTFFNNHWKSGASDPDTERIRVGNAAVLRRRLDEILDQNPLADIVIGGDLNSHYDQRLRHPEMTPNGINTILGSQGNEADLLSLQEADLYNLWYELPIEERGSEVYRNKWGSLMHLIISRGLYEQGGVTYVDGSFRVLAIPGRNTHLESGVPVRWQSVGDDGYGYSDHLPLVADFRCPESSQPDWIEIEQPAREDKEAEVRVALRREMAVAPETDALLKQVSNLGRLLRLRVEVLELDPPRVRRGDEEFPVWIPDRGLRREVTADLEPGSTVCLIAVVGMYKGEWQLVIEEADWVAGK
jgi:hypothetical protein